MHESPQKAPPASISEDAIELLEYRLSERVEKRVYEKIRTTMAVATGIFTVSGAVLGYFGAKQVGDVKAAAAAARTNIDQQKEEVSRLAESLRNEVHNFTESLVPAAKERLRYDLEIVRMARFPPAATGALLNVSEIDAWLQKNLPGKYQKTSDLESITALFARYNVSSTEQLAEVYNNLGIQNRVQRLYKEVLHREPDALGMFDKGVRMYRAGVSDQDIREELQQSEEARALPPQSGKK